MEIVDEKIDKTWIKLCKTGSILITHGNIGYNILSTYHGRLLMSVPWLQWLVSGVGKARHGPAALAGEAVPWQFYWRYSRDVTGK
jgi:hypothetical protein